MNRFFRPVFTIMRSVLPLVALLLAACLGNNGATSVSASTSATASKAITAFALNGTAGVIDETNKTIAVQMPYGTNLSALTATFTSTGTSVKVGSATQTSGVTANDFTYPVNYLVTAADGTTALYVVVVTLAPNPAKALTAFSVVGVVAAINETSRTVSVTLPFGTTVTSLAATFSTTGTSVKVGTTTQVSGVTTNDFTHPVSYTVTAADGSTANYLVTVTLAPSPAKVMTAFSVAGVAAAIDEVNHTITATLPYGTNLTALVATFTTTGAGVKVGATPQVSGVSANDFTNPVTYTVVAADLSSIGYVVTISTLSPSCTDGIKNGLETDVDCGGTCGQCATGKSCQAGADCVQGICSGNVCQPASCFDGIKNGLETDRDCGGTCGKCAAGLRCQVGGDCMDSVCGGNVCQPASCADGIKNGFETDIDCGGMCGKCAATKSCQVAADCTSNICTGNVCQ